MSFLLMKIIEKDPVRRGSIFMLIDGYAKDDGPGEVFRVVFTMSLWTLELNQTLIN